jgi:hypothetical protein
MGHVIVMKNIFQKYGYFLDHVIILIARIKTPIKFFWDYSYDQTELLVNVIVPPNL